MIGIKQNMIHRLLISLLTLHVAVAAGEPDEPATRESPLTSLTEAQKLPRMAFNVSRPLLLTGIVTLADAERNLLVIQDAASAIAIRPDPPQMPVRTGQRVELRAADSAPYLPYCPTYPFSPSGSDLLTSFELSKETGNYKLNRMRGWLVPPRTGFYTFWIASDDSSSLWLSPGLDPSQAKRIAHIETGSWTTARQWDRYANQRSERVQLQAGKAYYIEALQEQQTGENHLAVAWSGPDMPQAVISGQYLAPWRESDESADGDRAIEIGKGIMREYWLDYTAGNLAPVLSGVTNEGGLTVRGLQIKVLDDHVWPEPHPIQIGQSIAASNIYRWVEGEGAVTFLSTDGVSANLELTEGSNRLLLRVARWRGNLPQRHTNLRARFRGVCEGGHDFGGPLIASIVWAATEEDVSFFEQAGSQPLSPPTYPSDTAEGSFPGHYFTRGVVTFNDRVRDKDILYVQDKLAGISISQDHRQLGSSLRVGQLVEIGGPLLPGKHAPALQAWTVNVMGWQNMPLPAIPSSQPVGEGVREGQWTEMDGVVRSVTANGTMSLMGKNGPFQLWLSGVDPSKLDRYVNSRLRARGVVSLETFQAPALLVPGPTFIEIAQPAPEVSTEPTPISQLTNVESQNEWSHMEKAVGTVTFCGEHHFFIQDATGGIRVHPLDGSLPKPGDKVQVIGFPGRADAIAQLTEVTWKSVEHAPAIEAATLDPSEVDASHANLLVKVEGRLVAQKTHGSGLIFELQSGRTVFEAALTADAKEVPAFEEGSMLSVTGISVFHSSSQRANLLLRSPADVVLIKGPPWWNLKRSATLIGLLLTVLAATMIRVQFLNRRFAHQKAARLAFARSMLENQENERRRIAASLHDSLGQDLLVIRNQTHRALQSALDHPVLRQRLEDISSTTLQAINEVREIAHNLRPYQLDRLGLTQAIRAIVRKVSETSPIDLASHVDEIDHLFDKESEIHIYRIVQEGINNIMKHSAATEAAVVVRHHPSRVSISIRDNGKGIDQDARSIRDGGLGLSGIEERAKIMNGSITIDSAPGQGVSLQIELPILTLAE